MERTYKVLQLLTLLEKYDMIVRYHLDEDIMKIMSDDITRIIDKLEENLHLIDILKKDMKNNKWLLYKDIKKEEREKITNEFIEYIASFPLSSYQKQNKSRREEGKHYLRIQHGKDII